MNRNSTLDAAKGLAIILVVFGHSVQRHVPNNTHMWYEAAIYQFHMALFMFISGYLAFGKVDARWLSRRFLQLMVPYLAWHFVLYYWHRFEFSGVSGPFYITEGGVWSSLLYSTLQASGLWFFPILFFICCLFYVSRGNPLILLAFTLAAIFIPEMVSLESGAENLLFLGYVAWFMPFFACGFFVAKYRDMVSQFSWLKWLAIAAFPLIFWLRGDVNYLWPFYPIFTTADIGLGAYRLLMSFLGIGMAFALVEVLIRVNILKRALCYLGLITIGIYPAEFLCMRVGIGTGITMAVTAAAVSLLISIAVVWLLQRWSVTDFLFLGKGKVLAPSRIKAQENPIWRDEGNQRGE